jgi:hypothetical protein
MSNDLEEFLRKAAERRQARQQSGGITKAVPATPEAPANPQPVTAPVEQRETLGPRLQSNIHPTSLLTKEIDQADDRIRARIHSQFDNSVSTIDTGRTTKSNESQSSNQTTNQPSKKKASKQNKKESVAPPPEKSLSSFEESRNDMTIERSASKMISTGSMLELLRNPQTLRTAFIASQIFERKF